MPVDRPTFSESWYRVAELRPRLRSTVQTYRQQYRGRMWHIVRDPANNQFFRVDDAGYFFVAMLDGRRTVSQVWEVCNEKLGDRAPTQNEVIQLLGQLYTSNLLQADLPPDAAGMFERYRKRIRREVTGYITNFLFVRIPFFDPENILRAWVHVFGWIFSWFGLALWLGLLAYAGNLMIGNIDGLLDQTQSVIQPDNLFLLSITFVVIKAIHEFGHGFACKRFGTQNGTGGEVHTIGIMLLVFMPVPYVDASSSWAFRSKWQRAVVSAAGMYVELAVAAIAVIVWANTAADTTVHKLAYNTIFIASVSTLLFNGNPLLRYDGYYLLSDVLEIPNLAQRSKQYLYYLVKKYIYGARRVHTTARGAGEKFWLLTYAIASSIYRVFISIAILLFIADALFFVGAIMAAAAIVTWVFVPLGKWMKYLATSGELTRCRTRAIATTALFFAAIILSIGVIRAPDWQRAEGIIEPRRLQVVNMQTDGFIQHALETDTAVGPDAVLITAQNRQLETQLQLRSAERVVAERRYREALRDEDTAAVQVYEQHLRHIDADVDRLQRELDALRVHPRHRGVWVAPQVDEMNGAYLSRGKAVGLVASDDDLIVRVVTDQYLGPRVAEELGIGAKVELRVNGRPDDELTGAIERILQAGSEQLPSAALGYAAGGLMQTAMDDPTRTVQRFFEVLIRVPREDARRLRLLSGQRIAVRFTLDKKPLAQQWYLEIRQLVQQRFSI